MQAHIVLAHPEARSYNANLAEVARRSLEAQGWNVSVSDLYGMGFDPCERAEHYAERQEPGRFDVQAEQRHASKQGRMPPIVAAEIERLDRAELLILQYPMWWHLPPAMLKGWFDRVLIFGEVYASQKRFEKGRFLGKRHAVGNGRHVSGDLWLRRPKWRHRSPALAGEFHPRLCRLFRAAPLRRLWG